MEIGLWGKALEIREHAALDLLARLRIEQDNGGTDLYVENRFKLLWLTLPVLWRFEVLKIVSVQVVERYFVWVVFTPALDLVSDLFIPTSYRHDRKAA